MTVEYSIQCAGVIGILSLLLSENVICLSGRTFHLCFPKNRILVEYPRPRVVVTSASDVMVTVTFSAPLMFIDEVIKEIEPGGFVEHDFDTEFHLEGSQIDYKGIVISATGDVTVQAGSINELSSDAFLVFPESALTGEYIVMSYLFTGDSKVYPQGPSQLAVVATVDFSEIKITLIRDDIILEDAGWGINRDGVDIQVLLDAGQTLQLQSKSDLTGTLVECEHPLAVFAGAVWTSVAEVKMGDHLVEQIPPTVTWGGEFITVPIATKVGGDVFRILARYDNTKIRMAGEDFRMELELKSREFEDFVIPSDEQVHMISNKQVLLAQFCTSNRADEALTGDPYMSLVSPVSQWINKYAFTTFPTLFPDGSFNHYVSVTIKETEISGLRLDSAPLPENVMYRTWQKVPHSPYSSAILQLPHHTPHTLTHTDASLPFGALLYGIKFQESYGLLLGQTFEPVDYFCVAAGMLWADWFDNDCDGLLDEEIENGIDDDGDGLIDEDVFNEKEPRFPYDDTMTTFKPRPPPTNIPTIQSTTASQATTITTTTTHSTTTSGRPATVSSKSTPTTTASTTTSSSKKNTFSSSTTQMSTTPPTTTVATTERSSTSTTSSPTTTRSTARTTTRTETASTKTTEKGKTTVKSTQAPSTTRKSTTTMSTTSEKKTTSSLTTSNDVSSTRDDRTSGSGESTVDISTQDRRTNTGGKSSSADVVETTDPDWWKMFTADPNSGRPASSKKPPESEVQEGYDILADKIEILLIPLGVLLGAPLCCCFIVCCRACARAKKGNTVNTQPEVTSSAGPDVTGKFPPSPVKPRQTRMDFRATEPIEGVSCKLGIDSKVGKKYKVATNPSMPRKTNSQTAKHNNNNNNNDICKP